jgi:Na+-driven multidrug efflux pump
MMVLEPSIINIGLGRTLDPDLALAAYGVAFSLALLVEAPILMILDASVARSTDRDAFLLVRRFTVLLAVLVTAVGLAVSLTPLYGLVVEELMNIPSDVADRARPTLQVLSFWPAPIAWRRAYQGLLIRNGRTGAIGWATLARLLTLAGGIYVGLLFLPDRGALVAGIAMDLSVAFEALLITAAARPVLRSAAYGRNPEEQASSLNLRDLWRFYRPLAMTTILRQTTRPMLNAGIAAAALARPSLAAWPVAWGLATLITGPAWSLQQLATALVVDHTSYRPVKRFTVSLSLLFTMLLASVAFSPLYDLVMGGIYNLSPELQELARPAVQIMSMLPLVMGIQSLLRGVLIRQGCTREVQAAMMANVIVLAVSLFIGVALSPVVGVTLAALATAAGNFAELAWLHWRPGRFP